MQVLLVTIDAEEDDAWHGGFRAQGHTVTNIRQVSRFQELCDRHEIRPTYLVDMPVVEDPASVEILREIQDTGRGEIGAHMHPWCTPPYDADCGSRESFMCNLPVALQRQKLGNLTDAIEHRFGRRPTAFRAGRYGLDGQGAGLLVELGYLVDSSVIPFTDYSPQGGPDFRAAPHLPYYTDGAELCVPCRTGPLLEVPVSVGFSRPDFRRAQRLRNWASRPWPAALHMVGILDRLGLSRRIKLSPEQANARQMKRLLDALSVQEAPCAVLMFHSSSLSPGLSPYVRDVPRLERFYEDLDDVFAYCRKRGMTATTLSAFARSEAARLHAEGAKVQSST